MYNIREKKRQGNQSGSRLSLDRGGHRYIDRDRDRDRDRDIGIDTDTHSLRNGGIVRHKNVAG